MKILEEDYVTTDGPRGKQLIFTWEQAAIDIGLESGIYVSVQQEYYDGHLDLLIKRIYFKLMEYEFENLRDLKKAVTNKAFL